MSTYAQTDRSGKECKQEAPDPVVDSLKTISTRNQWSLLSTLVKKLNKRIATPMTVKEVAKHLLLVPSEVLRKNGVWVHSFGSKYEPIVCVNPAYGRVNSSEEDIPACSCKGIDRDSNVYFSSQAYNAGRHACTASLHIASCSQWTPPSTGHLHSWRRGYA